MFGKILRIIGIILLGITAVITLLGGIGTTCVALNAANYEGMEAIAQYQWLYIFYVLSGIVIGVLGIWVAVALVRGKPHAYRNTLIVLLAGLLIGGLHMATSRALRGSSMPKDFIVYATGLTLIVFLLFRIPGIWQRINLDGHDDHVTGLGAGAALIVGGIATLTVQLWAGPTHIINGINYADVWHIPLTIIGWLAVLLGSAVLGGFVLRNVERPLAEPVETNPAALY
ncbi:MAG: hypothetical protein DHS20C20_29550 [Ardenticatenaceae bacterium]|nr:MAG: hypothetical protein DHS20C20_29550 [Ardenticatenaceae bacterium]